MGGTGEIFSLVYPGANEMIVSVMESEVSCNEADGYDMK